MKIHLEHNGTAFEFERQPMPEGHFRALCTLATAGVYVGMVVAVTALCGFLGLLAVVAETILTALAAA